MNKNRAYKHTIIKFPEFHTPGSIPEVPEITESCMTTYLSAQQRESFMCNYSKMVVKHNGKSGFYDAHLSMTMVTIILAIRCKSPCPSASCSNTTVVIPVFPVAPVAQKGIAMTLRKRDNFPFATADMHDRADTL